MTTNSLIIRFALTTLLAPAAPAISQQVSPPSTQANQSGALVNKAAELIDKNGNFHRVQKKRQRVFHGDTYLYVYDLKDDVLLNPAFPMREATTVTGQKDAKGNLFHNEIIKTAETKGSGGLTTCFGETAFRAW